MAAPIYPDFPKEEFDLRYRRARELMDAQGLDALLVTEEVNYVYFTGHRSQQNPIDNIRPYVFLLSRHQDPVCFVMPFEEGHIHLTTWVEDVQTYQLFKHHDVIAATLREHGLATGRIGCELGREQFLGVSYDDFNQLRELLPDATFVDASPIFLRLRVLKLGMIFACNPNFVTDFGFFNMEENLVVTETGYEFLTDPRAPRELPVLG